MAGVEPGVDDLRIGATVAPGLLGLQDGVGDGSSVGGQDRQVAAQLVASHVVGFAEHGGQVGGGQFDQVGAFGVVVEVDAGEGPSDQAEVDGGALPGQFGPYDGVAEGPVAVLDLVVLGPFHVDR